MFKGRLKSLWEAIIKAHEDGEAIYVKSSHKCPYCSRKLRLIFGVTIPSDLSESHLQMLDYEKLIYHPQFSVSSIDYDVMLIKLQREVELNDYVKLSD